jgi:hypothetical protein
VRVHDSSLALSPICLLQDVSSLKHLHLHCLVSMVYIAPWDKQISRVQKIYHWLHICLRQQERSGIAAQTQYILAECQVPGSPPIVLWTPSSFVDAWEVSIQASAST